MTQVMQSIVNSAHGVYSASVLSETHALYFQNNRIIESSVKVGDDYFTPFKDCIESEFDGFENETTESFFHPENEYFHENLDYISNGMCRVMMDDKQLWEIIEHEGELYALNPKAQWNEETEEYFI